MRPNQDLLPHQEELAAAMKVVEVQVVEDLVVDLPVAWEAVWAWEAADQAVLVVAKSTCQTFVTPQALR